VLFEHWEDSIEFFSLEAGKATAMAPRVRTRFLETRTSKKFDNLIKQWIALTFVYTPINHKGTYGEQG
jgi:hypothetical protein